jgi:hypothetical protein
VILFDRGRERALAMALPDDVRAPVLEGAVVYSPVDWRSLFAQGLPVISPQEAFGAVLLYPRDETEIDELGAQPFVADYLQDLAEQDREVGAVGARAEHVLIENGDAVISSCIPFDRPRNYTVHVRVPAFAQKQAQQLWQTCAEIKRWDWLGRIRFDSKIPWQRGPAVQSFFDLVYLWIPYAIGDDRLQLLTAIKELHLILKAGGCAFVVGPSGLTAYWALSGLRMFWQEPVEQLPTFRMHRTILPKARLKAGLTLFYVGKL